MKIVASSLVLEVDAPIPGDVIDALYDRINAEVRIYSDNVFHIHIPVSCDMRIGDVIADIFKIIKIDVIHSISDLLDKSKNVDSLETVG